MSELFYNINIWGGLKFIILTISLLIVPYLISLVSKRIPKEIKSLYLKTLLPGIGFTFLLALGVLGFVFEPTFALFFLIGFPLYAGFFWIFFLVLGFIFFCLIYKRVKPLRFFEKHKYLGSLIINFISLILSFSGAYLLLILLGQMDIIPGIFT
jgi:hypothetical protein